MADEEKIPMPLCVFCSAPWTDDMMKVYAGSEVETGYYGGVDGVTTTVVIDVICSSCGRVVYRKECEGDTQTYGDNLYELKDSP